MGMKLASAMICVLPAYGQAVTGEILGTATDATGAVVADDSVAVVTSASFLLEGPTEGGSRRVMMGLRYVF